MSMWKEVSFVTASKSRSRILKELDNKETGEKGEQNDKKSGKIEPGEIVKF